MKKSMRRIVIEGITNGSILVIILMAVMVFISQWTISLSDLTETAEMRISDAKERIEQSETDVDALTEQLNEEFLSKARAFAQMVQLNPAFLDDNGKLLEICATLNVDELHVTDEKGIIQWSTVPEYV